MILDASKSKQHNQFLSERNKCRFAYVALIAGLIAIGGGMFGIWMQGRTMYDGTPLHSIADVLCPEEIYLSICLASLVTSIGGLLLSWVILASKLTEKFSAAKRNVLFAVFTIALLAAIMVASKIATDQNWARAQAAANEYFKNMKTNAPAATLEKQKEVR